MWHACLGVCHLTWPFNGKVDLCLENREAPKVWRPAESLFVTVSLLTQGSPCPTEGITKKAVSTHESLEEVMVGRKTKKNKKLGGLFFSESFVSYPLSPSLGFYSAPAVIIILRKSNELIPKIAGSLGHLDLFLLPSFIDCVYELPTSAPLKSTRLGDMYLSR